MTDFKFEQESVLITQHWGPFASPLLPWKYNKC